MLRRPFSFREHMMEKPIQHEILWELRHVTKEFAAVRALNDVSIRFRTGEIHALLGENGSGKSTMIKCIAGVHQPETGEILYRGSRVEVSSPIVARKLGVATIFQEFSLVPTLSVCENIFLGRLPRKGASGRGAVDWDRMRREASDILAKLGIQIDPMAIVGMLSVAQQQLVEITKAISIDATLLIMDEPTAALGQSEIVQLHALTRRLRDDGCAIIYISHRLDEVVELVDRVTVLKDGRIVGGCRGDDLNTTEIVRLMVGSDISEHYPKEHNVRDEVVYRVSGMVTETGVRDVSLHIRRGEVLGLAGLIGAGRTEIARAIFGADALRGGRVEIHGRPVRVRRPQDAIRNGIAFLSENRKSDGLFMNFYSGPNITIVNLKKILRHRFLNLKKERAVGEEYIRKLQISAAALDKSVQFLSGGNQQKVVIARWLHSGAELIILDEPTQGIDIKAKVEVYNLINELTRDGKAVLLISSDLEELFAMSDRVAVVKGGHVLSILDTGEITKNQLMEIILGNQIVEVG